MGVCKSGRTTAFTPARSAFLEATMTVNYGSERVATFEGQIVSTPMSQGGDSGSLLVTSDTTKRWAALCRLKPGDHLQSHPDRARPAAR